MLKFLLKEDHPLRVYLEGDPREMSLLSSHLRSMFYRETDYSTEEDVDNIIFLEEIDKKKYYYFPRGLYHIVSGSIIKLNLTISEDSYVPDVEVQETINIADDILDGIILRPYQLDACNAALSHKYGIVQVSTGS